MVRSQNKHSKYLFVLFAAVAVFVCVIPAVTHAQDHPLEVRVIDPSTLPDVCPNIPGTQTTLPDGMQLDASGNCFTPTPPPTPTPTPNPTPTTPAPTDLCKNISGAQAMLPSGYYRTASGNCYAQPTPPAPAVDVCPSIDGLQLTVPEGYYLASDNTCAETIAPTDVCPNIPGPQETIPNGMELYNGICYTPLVTSQNTNTTNNSNTTNSTQSPQTGIKNVPSFLEPITKSLVNIVPEGARQWLQSLPAFVAQTMPYYIFIIVGVLAIVPIIQSVHEAFFARQLAVLLKKERDIAEQKDNFVTLASHYLRTPLTLMKSGLDTIASLNELPAETIEPLNLHLAKLDTDVGMVLGSVENNAALRGIAQPVSDDKIPPVWRSIWFWGPIAGSALLTVLANFFFAVVGDKEIGITNEIFQFLVAATVFVILYLGVRNLHLQKKLHQENQLLIDHERVVDEARNSFITNSTNVLKVSLEPISQSISVIEQTPSFKFFNEGYERMNAILQRFLLLSQVQAGTDRNLEVFDLNEAVDNLLVTYSSAISEKRLTVANMTSTTFIKQNRNLFNFVLGSALDNAIKFNQDGGSIEISAEPGAKMLSIKVTDNGVGVKTDKIGQLFKPFSRASSAVEFNYEGLGFSLFLDKIIMDYTGGEIDLVSNENEGTRLLISTPVVPQAPLTANA